MTLEADTSKGGRVEGTTLRVYRFIFRQGHPVGVHDVQRAMGFASASTAHYHVQKLLTMGLVKSDANGPERDYFEGFFAYSTMPWKSIRVTGSTPTTHASCPGGTHETSPGPTSISAPSSITMCRTPVAWYWK